MRVFAELTARSKMFTTFGAMAFAGLSSTLAPAAIAQTAGTTSPVTTSANLKIAGSLLDSGQLIEARATLLKIAGDNQSSDADRLTATDLLSKVNDRIQSADMNEIALQKAEFALREGDLRTAERQASPVANGSAPSALKARAATVLTQVSARRAELEPQVAKLIGTVESNFNKEDYTSAKLALSEIVNSGIALSDRDQMYVDAYQVRIVELERLKAKTGGRLNFSVMQDGTVRPKDPVKFVCPKCQATTPCADCVKMMAEQTKVAGEPIDLPKLPAIPPDPYFPSDPGVAPAPAPVVITEPAPMPMPIPEPMPVVVQPMPMPVAQPAPATDNLMMMALQAQAQWHVAEGDKLFTEGRYAEAARQYELALGSQRQYLTSGDITHAEQKLAECKVRLASPTGGTLENSVLKASSIARDKATVEFENDLAEANKAIAAGNGERAIELANRAKFVVEQNKAYFSQSEYDGMMARAAAAKADLQKQSDAIKAADRAKADQDAIEKNKHLQFAIKKEKEKKVVEGIDRIRALQKEQRYDEAMDICNQVLFIDPQNPTAGLLREVLSDLVVYRKREMLERNKRIGMTTQKLENFEATNAPLGLINYPTNWPSITMLRTGAGGYMESEENRKATASLQKEIPAKFDSLPLTRALAYIGNTTNVRLETDWKSLAAVGIEPSTPVTLDLGQSRAELVLQRMLNQVSADRFNKADYAVRDGILTVGSADAIKQQTVTLTYPITDMLLFAPDYTDVPDMNLEHKYAAASDKRAAKGDPFKTERASTIPEKRERIRQLVSVIQRSIDPDSWKENGGDIGSVTELNGVLVITNTPRNHREITGLLSKLREIRQTQINIEARFLLVNQDFFEQINFDIDMYFNANSTSVTAARANDPNILPSNFFTSTGQLVASLDSNAYRPNSSVTPVLVPPGQTDRFQGPVPLASNWSPIGAPSNGNLAASLVPANNSFISGLLNQAPALGIAGRYLDDIQVDFLIKATQADNRTVSLTAPRLTFTNGQIANVVVGTQRAYVSDLTPLTGDSAIGFDPIPATLTEGVTLLVEAVASADRRYVTMNIETAIAQLKELVPFTETAAAAGGGVGGGAAVPIVGTFQLPTLSVSQVNTTVTVPDQGTILLGGQRLTSEVEIETGVPVLSKMPIINRFFTNRIQSRQDQSLLMLVKPTVLVQSEEEEKAFPGLNDSLRGN